VSGGSQAYRRVGIDNYGLSPLDLSPMETLEWALVHNADGVAFSGIADHHRDRLDNAALHDLREFASGQGLYLEWGGAQHIPRDMTSWARKDLEAINARAAREAERAGTRIIRSCSGGLMRWDATSPPTEELLRDTAEALRALLPILRDHDVVLAIETHFEFTSFELLRVFEMCEVGPGDALGICLDTMNLLTLLEHPVWAAERLAPWVVSTHVKDGGILLGADGFTTFPVAPGAGIIHLARISAMLPADVDLSIESHGGHFLLPIHDATFLAKFPDLTGAELEALIELSEATAGRPACRPLDRERWPEVCEARMASDIKVLKALVNAWADGYSDARVDSHDREPT
jgi:sugar phosphate isomerase/epimerase